MKKKILSALLALTVSAGCTASSVFSGGDAAISGEAVEYYHNVVRSHTAYEDKIYVYVDGSMLHFDVDPEIRNDRTMVPLRGIFEALGASVTWDDGTKTIYASAGSREIRLTIGDSTMHTTGGTVSLDSPAVIVNGRTLVPVRAISEAFSCDVRWFAESKSVSIVSDSVYVTPATISASSVLGAEYGAEKAFDGRRDTMWAEGTDGIGIGEYIAVSFDTPQNIQMFSFYVGNAADAESYVSYNRPAEFTYVFYTKNGVKEFTWAAQLHEYGNSHLLHFAEPYTEVERLEIYPTKVYAATKYDITCISEFTIYDEALKPLCLGR